MRITKENESKRIGCLTNFVIFLLIALLFNFSQDSSISFQKKEVTKGDDLNWRLAIPSSAKKTEFQTQQKVAKIYCSSCHEYVPPDMLDRITWPRVLSIMKQEMIQNGRSINETDWLTIQQFYLSNSPKVFHSTTKKYTPKLQQLFEETSLKESSTIESDYTLLKHLESNSTILLGRPNGQILSLENNSLNSKFSIPNIPVDISYFNDAHLVLGIGTLAPSPVKKGQLIKVDSNQNSHIIIDSLHRPIHFQTSTIKGETGFTIASFGSTQGNSGDLSFFKDKSFKRTLIDSLSGATQAELRDLNQDGIVELIALFSQANERINVYECLENDSFQLKSQIPFSPVFGSSSFQLSDFNKDGFLDIVVTNGDNDDYSQIFKPYHGVRIYLNDQLNNFKLAYYYHINGASKVKSADMDKDGDMDFVVLAMYPDLFSRPWETLLYFENIGDLNFRTHYFEAQPTANWMLLEMADIDGDDDMDIITAANSKLGGLIPPELRHTWSENRIGVKIYYNKTY